MNEAFDAVRLSWIIKMFRAISCPSVAFGR